MVLVLTIATITGVQGAGAQSSAVSIVVDSWQNNHDGWSQVCDDPIPPSLSQSHYTHAGIDSSVFIWYSTTGEANYAATGNKTYTSGTQNIFTTDDAARYGITIQQNVTTWSDTSASGKTQTSKLGPAAGNMTTVPVYSAPGATTDYSHYNGQCSSSYDAYADHNITLVGYSYSVTANTTAALRLLYGAPNRTYNVTISVGLSGWRLADSREQVSPGKWWNPQAIVNTGPIPASSITLNGGIGLDNSGQTHIIMTSDSRGNAVTQIKPTSPASATTVWSVNVLGIADAGPAVQTTSSAPAPSTN